MNATFLYRIVLTGLALALVAPSIDACPRYRPALLPARTAVAPAAAANAYQSFSYEPAAAPQWQPAATPVFRSMSVRGTSSMQQNAAAYGKFR